MARAGKTSNCSNALPIRPASVISLTIPVYQSTAAEPIRSKVKAVIQEALSKSSSILQDPEPEIGIETFDSHNIILAVRPYIHPDDYWDATFEVYGLIKNAFNEAGIKAAYSEGVELGPIGD